MTYNTIQNSLHVDRNYLIEEPPKEKFAECVKKIKYNRGIEMKTIELAEKLNIDFETFKKILYMTRPTENRDCIIGIGVIFRCNHKEINRLLKAYSMPTLNMDDDRDVWIYNIAQKNKYDESKNRTYGIEEFNNRLQAAGFAKLNIHGKGGIKNEFHSDYNILKSKVLTHIDEIFHYGDQYNSLATTYNPDYFKSYGIMIINNKKNNKTIRLVADNRGGLSSEENNKEHIIKNYNCIEETGELRYYFEKVHTNILKEEFRLLTILNDTKNYGNRVSARFKNDSICFFAEEFDYSIPEYNEYFFMEMNKGQYQLNIYNQSAFMYYYLGEKKYKKFYEKKYEEPQYTFDSIEEIDDKISKSNSEGVKFKRYKNAFNKMKSILDNLRIDISERRKFILNLGYIYENPTEVLRYYNVEEKFECKYDKNTDEIINYNGSALFTLEDQLKVTITFEDICRGFELGFENIQDIARIKNEYGDIESVL